MSINRPALRKAIAIGVVLALILVLASQIQAAVMMRHLTFDNPQEDINSARQMVTIVRWTNTALDMLVGMLYAYVLFRENPMSNLGSGVLGAGIASLIVRAIGNTASFLVGPAITDVILWDGFNPRPPSLIAIILSDSFRSLSHSLGATMYVSLLAAIAGVVGSSIMMVVLKKLLHHMGIGTTP